MFRKPKKKPSALRTNKGNSNKNNNNNSFAAAANTKKRPRPRQSRDSSSDDDDDNDEDDINNSSTSDLLQQIRQERMSNDAKKSKTLLNTSGTIKKSNNNNNKSKGSSMMHQYKSSNSQLSAQEMATRTAEYHPTSSNNNNNTNNSASTKNNTDSINKDETNKAQNAQLPSLQKPKHNPFHAGPLKATTFVRTTARFDYQPDICKDYKETGFCGFGDTCIYLHDRGDSKSGWQMEQEYEDKKRRMEERRGVEMDKFMRSMMGSGDNDNSCTVIDTNQTTSEIDNNDDGDEKLSNTNDGIPFACHICRGPFQNPVVTTCGHYYCEACMQNRIRESGLSTCPICHKDTSGVLNYPQKLVAKKRRLVGRDGSWEDYLAKK